MMAARLVAFMTDPANSFAAHTFEYVGLCAAAGALAVLAGGALGVAVARRPVLAFAAINASGLMRAIPVIAFLAFAIPYLGLGFLPSLIALTVLGVPPVLVNTCTGIRTLDPAIIDAARGCGMTRWQIIGRVQLPLILPVIAAGARTAVVQIVATATLAAIIGAGGYGDYILSGLYQVDVTQILAGAIPVTLLAILAELVLSRLQRLLTPPGLRDAAGR
ncbi:MAG TPA: ABC transporter permease [bacterium]|nr:ABC transporter permease [bacterium]